MPSAQEKKPTLSKVLKGVAAPSISGEQPKSKMKNKHNLKTHLYKNLLDNLPDYSACQKIRANLIL